MRWVREILAENAKRKYVMVGEGWGTLAGNKDQWLELLIEDWKLQDATSPPKDDVGTTPLPLSQGEDKGEHQTEEEGGTDSTME